MGRVPLRELLTQGIELPKLGAPAEPTEYIPVGVHAPDGNPFIEVFGRQIVEAPEFVLVTTKALPLAPKLGSPVRANPILAALEMASLYDVVYPTPSLVRLFVRILEVLAMGYLKRSPLQPNVLAKTIFLLKNTPPKDLCKLVMMQGTGSPLSLSVVGASGMGKTFGVQHVLSYLTQVWRHRSYHGRPMNHLQVVWLNVTCPPTGTLKGLLLSILLQLDFALGTSFYANWLLSRVSTDVLLINVALILYCHGVGVVVLDELQHLRVRGFHDTELMLNFFVALMNFLSMPLICVGTYSALNVLSTTMRDGRRLAGAGYIEFNRYEQHESVTRNVGKYYLNFLPGVDKRQAAALQGPVYDIYQGIHFLLPNLVHRVTAELSYRGMDHVTEDVLKYYQEVELKPIAGALEALRKKDVDAIEAYGDLLSPEVLKALRENQSRRDKQRESIGWGGSASAGPSPGSRTFTVDEFPCGHIKKKEIDSEVRRTLAMFGDGDLYPALKHAGLIATDVIRGRLLPEGG